jgi:hypothetical protein
MSGTTATGSFLVESPTTSGMPVIRFTFSAPPRIKLGHQTLTRSASVVFKSPDRELWLFQNKTALESVSRGLRDARRGELTDRGSFAKYADDEID